MSAASTQVYIYQQKARVVVYDSSVGEQFTYRYYTVYASKLKINKGVDNVILFEFINQEEKPFNIFGSNLVFRLINTEGDQMLLEKPMDILNAGAGWAKVTIKDADILEVDAQPASYSISRASGNLNEAVYTDAQCGARAPIDIVNSVEPAYVPSVPLTIPTTELTTQTSLGGTAYADFPGWSNPYYAGYMSSFSNGFASGVSTEFYSSFIEPSSPVTTVQLELLGYTGTIKAMWAENYQSVWYNATESKTYYNYTGTIHWNIVGWYPLLRMAFNNSLYATLNPPGQPCVAVPVCTNGVITSVEIVTPGSGYMAPPLVNFIGDGAGAIATTEINEQGSVTAINVIEGGSGYWPLPIYTPNPVTGWPVPPNQAGAICIVSTGYVVAMWYR